MEGLHKFHCHHFLESGQRRSKEEPTLLRYSQKTYKIWGDRRWGGIPNYRGQAGHLREVVHIYRHSAINIDINRIYQSDIITMRVFDVIASGGFILTEYTPALDDVFDVGVEIATYRTMEELVEKVDYYLAHPQERQKIIDAGRARVLREHTMAHRADRMLSEIHEK